MKCNNFRDIIITDYVDGELDEQGKQEIGRHLQDCPACRAFAAAVRSMAVDPLRQTAPEETPPFLWTRIQSRLEQQVPQRRGIRWLNVVVTMSMFLVMTVAGNYLVSGMISSPAQQEIMASAEVSQQLSLTEFNDMPDEQVETIYNSIIGG